MTMPATLATKADTPGKRLILAAAAAIACQLLLTFVVSYIPGIDRTSFRSPLGWLQPASHAIAAVSMSLGGRLAGKRFVVVALAVTALVWLGTLYVLAQTTAALTGKPFGANLVSALAFNKANIACALLAAALGALAGAWWRGHRALQNNRLP
ncbi:MAG: hypothetical protein QM599_06115 [Pseudoxanthomonas sp.]